MSKSKKLEYNLNADHIDVKASSIVKLHQYLTIIQTDGQPPLDLRVDITTDLVDIPEQYHEIILNMMTSKYLGKVSFSNNPFSKAYPPAKHIWWEFWKAK